MGTAEKKSFQFRFKRLKRRDLTDVQWDGIPDGWLCIGAIRLESCILIWLHVKFAIQDVMNDESDDL